MNDTTATLSHRAPQEVMDLPSLGLAAAAAAIRKGEITSEAYTSGTSASRPNACRTKHLHHNR
ncbi:hypothetical protein ACVIGA_007746 [Bradyrhizobium sp. USDA 3240]